MLLIIGLFTLYNTVHFSVYNKELNRKLTPLLERSQEIAKSYEALEDRDSLEEFKKKATEDLLSDQQSVRYIVLDRDQRVVTDSYNFKQAGESLPMDIADSVRARGSYQKESYQNSRGEQLLYSAYPVFDRDNQITAFIIAMTSLEGMSGEIERLLKPLLVIGIFFILLSILIYFGVLREIFAPLDKLEEGVEAMTRGNYGYQIEEEEEGNDLATILRSFNTLGFRLADIENQQKDFVSTLSHELKTPIASMKIITDSLIQAKDQVSLEIIYDFLEDINTESDRLKDIIDDLLFMASLEKKDVSLNLDVRPITRALEESIRVMKPLSDQKNIEIHLDIQEKLFAEFDYNKMKQVFINLIGNAVKYTDEGGEIFINASADKDKVYFEVRDTGIGMAKEELPFVFDRLFRVDRARSRERGGTGLGLHIAQQIINLHNGKISMDSELDVGSTVYIELPRKYGV